MGNTEAKYCPINECSDARLICGPTRSYTNVLKSVSNIGDRVTMVLNDISFTGTLSDSTSMSHLNAVIGTYITITYMYQYESMVDMLCGNHKHIYAIRYKTPELSKQQYRLDEYTNTDTLTRMRDIRGYTILLYRDQHDYMKLYNKLTFGQETDVTFAEVDIDSIFTRKTIIDMQLTKPFKYEKNIIIEGLISIHNIDVWLDAGIKRNYFEAVVAGSPKCKFAIPKTMGTIARNKTYSVDVVKMSTGDTWYEIKAITEVIS